MPKIFNFPYLTSFVFGTLLSFAYVQSASAEMLWEVNAHQSEAFNRDEVRGYGMHCREGSVISGSISLEEPIPATPTLYRAARGFDVFENRKSTAGRWDFSVANLGSAATVRVTVSIVCYTGEVTEYLYD